MMNRTRVVETMDGYYMPQFKLGFLSRWRFFKHDADQDTTLLIVWIQTFDPLEAAKFTTKEGAQNFIKRVVQNADQRNQEEHASKLRQISSTPIKRVYYE